MTGAFVRPGRRSVLLLDALTVAWVVAWIVVGVLVAREVQQLAQLGDTVELAAGAIEQTGDVLGIVGNVPFIGGRVGQLAERIHETGTSARAGAAESRESVRSLSLLLGFSVAAMPTLLLLAAYVPLRIAWRRDVQAIRRALRRDPSQPALDEYLARRAVTVLPYAQLRRITENPWRDLEAGHYRPLADAELARLGIRRPQART